MRNARVWQRVLGVARTVVEAVVFDEDTDVVVVSVRPRKGARRRCGRCGRRAAWFDRGRAFSNKAVEMGLASYPGYFMLSGPLDARPFGVHWPTLVSASAIAASVVVDGARLPVDGAPTGAARPSGLTEPATVAVPADRDWGPTARRRLGAVVGARSGDKGGNANVGVWSGTEDAFEWLAWYLTVERLSSLLPEIGTRPVERHDLPNILSLNFVVTGLLGRGVAATTRLDGQAKALGERLRAAWVDVPESLVGRA